MTISWGMMGIEWGKPVFITVIREGRFTRELLQKERRNYGKYSLDSGQSEKDSWILRLKIRKGHGQDPGAGT